MSQDEYMEPVEETKVPSSPSISSVEIQADTKEFDDSELMRQNRRIYFPKPRQLANLLRSHDNAARQKIAAIIGHTLSPRVYQDLVYRITQPLPPDSPANVDSEDESGQRVAFVRGNTEVRYLMARDVCTYLEMSDSEFQASEPIRDVYGSSALRFLRGFEMENINTVPERSLAMYTTIRAKCNQRIPELERVIIVEDLERFAPLGCQHPKQWLQNNKLLNQVEAESKPGNNEFDYLASIWYYAQWYKQHTHVDWAAHYYVPWRDLATTKFRERVLDKTLNLKPRRPLVICAGRDRAWLVHCHTTGRMYRCADSLMALCVWTHIVSSQFDGVDNYGKKIPLVPSS